MGGGVDAGDHDRLQVARGEAGVLEPLDRDHDRLVEGEGKGEEQSGGRHRAALIADALEAVIGAAYLDGGIKGVHRVFEKLLLSFIRLRDYQDRYFGTCTTSLGLADDHSAFISDPMYRQHVMPFASPSQVKEEIHRVFEACGTPDGGIIACGEVGPDVPLANIRAMYEAFREYGVYR